MRIKSAHPSASGLLLVLSAPSGTGKTTVMKELFRRDKNFVDSVSWTTRKARPGEKHGKDYFFVTEKRFLEAIRMHEFLEWARVYGRYYGTPRKYVEGELRRGRDVLLVIDTRGAAKVRHFKPSVHIFLKPPSIAILKTRLKSRNSESEEELARRLKEARYEMKQAHHYDYRIVNHTVAQTVSAIETIVKKKRFARSEATKQSPKECHS